jgi:hypothetical protein
MVCGIIIPLVLRYVSQHPHILLGIDLLPLGKEVGGTTSLSSRFCRVSPMPLSMVSLLLLFTFLSKVLYEAFISNNGITKHRLGRFMVF